MKNDRSLFIIYIFPRRTPIRTIYILLRLETCLIFDLQNIPPTILRKSEQIRERVLIESSRIYSCFPVSASRKCISFCTRTIFYIYRISDSSIRSHPTDDSILRSKNRIFGTRKKPTRNIDRRGSFTRSIATCPHLSSYDDISSRTSRISESRNWKSGEKNTSEEREKKNEF